MKNERIWKLGLSLMIAVAFILPTGAIADEGGQGASGGQILNELKIVDGISDQKPNLKIAPIQSSLAEQEVCIVDINMSENMAVGCYDINITLENSLVGLLPIDCEIKAFMDIFKEEDKPKEEIICFDFEDTWDIYNYWDSVDDTLDSTSGPGGIDTWTRSDQKSSSPSYSMRCTQFDDHYMGNQLDYLMAHIENTEAYEEIIVDFCSWVDGEIIFDDESDTDSYILEDYGWCQYSFDGINWVDSPCVFDAIPELYYYDEPEWNCSKTHTIPGTAGETDIYFRFAWTSGPTIQNEGWFVDDVCFSGREAADLGVLVFTTHSLHQFVVPMGDGTQYIYEFPETWCPDEGNYTIRIWLLSETEECDVCYPQADPFLFNVTIGDVYDIAVTANCITDPAVKPYEMGDDLMVEGTVCNEGTLDAQDVAVTFAINRQIRTTHYDDLVEGAYYPDDYIPYHFENPDSVDGTVHGCNFGAVIEDPAYSQSGFWHIDELNSVSPTHSWYNADDTDHYPAGISDVIVVNFPACGIDDLEDMADAIDFDVTFQVNWEIAAGDAIYGYLVFGNSWSSFGGTRTGYQEPFFGHSTGGFVEYSLKDAFYWCGDEYGFDMGDMNPILYFAEQYADDFDISSCTGIGIGIDSDARDDTVGQPLGDWSGVMIDNMKITSVWEGPEVYKEVIIIDELLAETPTDPGECEDVDFEWEDMPTGYFIEKKSVASDDDNDNNEMFEPFSVEVLWAEVDEDDIETYDLTEGVSSHWHVTTSGYNNYLWCGEESTGTYGDEWNDILLFAPSGSDPDPEMDWSGLSPVYFELDEYVETELGADYCIMEINPHVTDPGYQWYQYNPPSMPHGFAFESFEISVPPPAWSVVDWALSGQSWIPALYPYNPHGHDPPGTGIWMAAADNILNVNTHCSLITPVIDMSVFPNFQLDFATGMYTVGGTDLVNVWTGAPPPGGIFEETIFDQNWYMPPGYVGDGVISIPIDPQNYVGPKNQVFLEFEYNNNFPVWDWMWLVDDVYLSASDIPTLASTNHGWQHTTYEFTPDKFFNPITAASFQSEIGGFTDEMGFRLRWLSDESIHQRGLLVDNLNLHGSGDVFDLDECDDLDNFILDTVVGGDWWYYDMGYGGWICEDKIAHVIPNDVDCALVWETSVPQAVGAGLHFTHEHDLMNGDYCYVEFSTDGGDSWIAPVRYTDVGSGDIELDMSSFTGTNVLIRWRVETNETELSTIYKVKDMKIFADIDEQAPVTMGTLSGTVIHGWYSTPVTFSATATDDYSGVAATYYKIDGGSTITYSAPITISVNGDHYIEYWSVDNVGNEEVHHTTPTFKIDTGDAPSVAITAPGDGLYLFGNQILSLSGRTIIIGGFTVQATASDSESGVYTVQFALDGTVFGESTASPYSAYCGEKHTGAGTITVTAEDFTGNTASASKDITYFKFL